MSVYLFVPSVLGLLLTYVSGSDIWKVPFHLNGLSGTRRSFSHAEHKTILFVC